MNTLQQLIASITMAVGTMGSGYTDTIQCDVVPLDDYGFVQTSVHNEYVCVNGEDYTDFVVIEDPYDEFRVGDLLELDLDYNAEVLDYEVIMTVEERY